MPTPKKISQLESTAAAVVDPAGMIAVVVGGVTYRIAVSELALLLAPTIDARMYGVVGDGTTDDTEAVQAALDAGTETGRSVVLPPGTFKITETLTYGAAGEQSYFSVFGAGGLATTLRWEGASTLPDSVAIRAEGMIMGGLHGFGIADPYGADGTGTNYGEKVGLWLANTTGSGSGQNGNCFSNMVIQGFNTGLLAGDVANTRAASELTFQNLRFQYCNTGFSAVDSNTLDLDLYMLQVAHCGTGLSAGQCGNLHVYGGSSTGNVVDFQFSSGGTFSVNGYRTETTSRHVVKVQASGVAPCKVSIRNCNFQQILTGGGDYGAGTGGSGGGAAVILHGAAEVLLDACHIEGWVGVADYYSLPLLRMYGTTVRPLPGQTGPFAFYYGTDGSGVGDRYLNLRYDVRGCSRMAQDDPFWPDDDVESRPDASAFFADGSGTVTGGTSRDVPALWGE